MQTQFGIFRQGNSPLNSTLTTDADAITTRTIDSNLFIAAGRFSGQVGVNKFGRAPQGIQTTSTDVWDRADATPTQQIWVAPTQARVHAIVSSNAADKGTASPGTGLRTLRIYGLTAWTSKETSEDITMNGTNPVNTVNSYVIIHRMQLLTAGTGGTNAGTITATAATDGTITAVIRPGIGSTTMAIYGWSSLQTFFVKIWRASINKSSAANADILLRLFYNPEPSANLTSFREVDVQGIQSNGTSSATWEFATYLALPGPGILKVNGLGSGNDLDCTAQFSGVLVDN